MLFFLSCVCVCVSVSTTTQGGLYVFQIYDHFSCSGASLLLLSIFQSIAIGWIYGKNAPPPHVLSFAPCLSSPLLSSLLSYYSCLFPLLYSPFTLFTFSFS